MLNEQTITILNSLKLFGMARGISERLANPGHGELSHADFVGLLVQDEKTYRDISFVVGNVAAASENEDKSSGKCHYQSIYSHFSSYFNRTTLIILSTILS